MEVSSYSLSHSLFEETPSWCEKSRRRNRRRTSGTSQSFHQFGQGRSAHVYLLVRLTHSHRLVSLLTRRNEVSLCEEEEKNWFPVLFVAMVSTAVSDTNTNMLITVMVSLLEVSMVLSQSNQLGEGCVGFFSFQFLCFPPSFSCSMQFLCLFYRCVSSAFESDSMSSFAILNLWNFSLIFYLPLSATFFNHVWIRRYHLWRFFWRTRFEWTTSSDPFWVQCWNCREWWNCKSPSLSLSLSLAPRSWADRIVYE